MRHIHKQISPLPHIITEKPTPVELVCSECGDYCLHPIEITIEHAGTKGMQVMITANGVFLDPIASLDTTFPTSRGVIYKILYECEMCPTLTEHTYYFHKGTTFWSIRRILMDGYDPTRHRPINTIWKD